MKHKARSQNHCLSHTIILSLFSMQLIFPAIDSQMQIMNRFQRIERRKPSHHAPYPTHFPLHTFCLDIIRDDFLLNDDTIGGARQQNPSIAVDHSGNTIITWTDFRDGNADIYCQRFNAAGNMIGQNFRINADAGMMWQGEPAIAMHTSGNFIVAWEDRRFFNSDVYVQRFNEQGVAIDTNFRANDNTGTSDQRNTAAIMLPNRDFIVVWDDWRNDWGDIYGQRCDSLGHPSGANFRVNDDIPGGTQYAPSISQDSLGNFVVAWMDGRNGDWDVYAQRFNRQGQQLGINFCVNDGSSAVQGYPEVARTRAGQFIVVWEDQRLGNSDIYGQRFDASGNRLGGNFKVNGDIGTSSQASPDIAVDSLGNFIVTWADIRLGNYDIFAQRYNNTGIALGQNFKVNNDATTQDQSTPSIAIKPNGDFWIVWDDNRQSNNDIFFQMYYADGSPNGLNRKINDDIASSNQRCSWIAQDGTGNYIAVWEDERNSHCDIYGMRFDSIGNFLGNNFRVNDDMSNADQFYASVASNFNGDFVITWTDGRNNNFYIYAQRFLRTGTPVGPNFRVNDDTSGTKWYPVVSSDSLGNTIIVWIDYRNNSPDIYGQLYDYQGNPVGNNFTVNNIVNGSQMYPFVARNHIGDFIVAWMDDRNGNFDVYAQRFDHLGNPVGSNFRVNDDISSSSQGYPGVAMDLAGNFYIVWEDERNGSTDIYLQRYNVTGVAIGSNLRVDDDNAAFDQYSPTIACDETGKYIIVWCDFRNGDDDPEIYAQAFNANGTILDNNRLINQTDLFPGNNQWLIGQGVAVNSRRISYAWIDNRRHKGWDIYSKIVDWNYFTGVNEEIDQLMASSNFLKIFPNPSTGKISLTSSRDITSDIQLFNSTGRKIKTISIKDLVNHKTKLEVNLSQFSPGIYFIQFNIRGLIATRKIIINSGRKSVKN